MRPGRLALHVAVGLAMAVVAVCSATSAHRRHSGEGNHMKPIDLVPAYRAQQRAVELAKGDVRLLPNLLDFDIDLSGDHAAVRLSLRTAFRGDRVVSFTDGTHDSLAVPVAVFDGKVVRSDSEEVESNLAHLTIFSTEPAIVAEGFFYVDTLMYRIVSDESISLRQTRSEDDRGRHSSTFLILEETSPLERLGGCGSGSGGSGGSNDDNPIVDEQEAPRTPAKPLSSLHKISIGVHVDCNVWKGHAEPVISLVNSAVSFANQRYFGQMNLALQLTSLVVTPKCHRGGETSSIFQQSCTFDGNNDISRRLDQFSFWRGQRNSDEGLWVDITNCYLPSQQGSIVGLSWTRSVCYTTVTPTQNSTATAVVSMPADNMQTAMLIFTHEIGHILGAIHDEDSSSSMASGAASGGKGCTPHELPDPSPFVMATVTPSGGLTSTVLSPCSIEWIYYYLQNYNNVPGMIAPCLQPVERHKRQAENQIITAVSPVLIAAQASTVLTLTIAASYLIASSQVGLSSSAQCSTPEYTYPLTSTTVSADVSQANVWFVCYSADNGAAWDSQLVNVTSIEQSPTLLANIAPNHILVNSEYSFITSSSVNTPETRIALSTSLCANGTIVSPMTVNATNQFSMQTSISNPGNYSVCISTTSGQSYVQADGLYVLIGASPSSPTNLKASNITSSQVTFTWTDGFDNFSPIYSFLLEVSTGSPDPTTTSFIKFYDGVSEFSAQNLQASTSYSMSMYEINSFSYSPLSAALQFTTLAPSAPGPISDLSGAGSSAVALELTWSPPSETGGVPIQGYLLTVSDESSNATIATLEVASSSTSTSIGSGVSPGHNYTVNITAFNSYGQSPPAYFVVTSLAATVPGSPINVVVTNATETSFSIQWQPPPDDGNEPLTAYAILVQLASDLSFVINETFPSTVLTFDAIGFNITAATQYNIEVFAVNTVGTGAASTVVSVTTPGGSSGSPSNWFQGNLYVLIGIVVIVGIISVLFVVMMVTSLRRTSVPPKVIHDDPRQDFELTSEEALPSYNEL